MDFLDQAEDPVCPDCKMPMPADSPGGFCPRCLMGSQTLGRGSDGARTKDDWPSPEELDRKIEGFEITELLGFGGMGAVYKARQARLNRTVAVKILPVFEAAEDREAFDERFEREAQTMAKLTHPHIVTVHDFGETSDGQLYIVMEYVEGTDLGVLIQSGKVEPEHALRWVRQMCEALEYAHANGVVHRDVKPSNILVVADGKSVKIADFGIAQLGGKDEEGARMTMADMVVGTPEYLAPEQSEGGSQVDHRADIYSLGVLIYEMMTGELPGEEMRAGLKSKESASGNELDEVVLRAMQHEPGERYQSTSELSADVMRMDKQEDGRRRLLVLGLVACCLFVFAWLWMYLPGSSASPDEKQASEFTFVMPVWTGGALPQECTAIEAVKNEIERPVHALHVVRARNTAWNKNAFWSNGPAPVTKEGGIRPYHYYLYAGRILTLTGVEDKYHFGGLSLTAGAGSAVVFSPAHEKQEVFCQELNLDGGHLDFVARGGIFSGTIKVLASSSMKTRGVEVGMPPTLSANLLGSQRLSYSGTGIRLEGRSPNFSGGWRIRGNVDAHASHSLGTGSILIESGTVDSNDTVRLTGSLDLWGPGRVVLDQVWSVEAARIDGVVLPPGEYRFRDLEVLGYSDLFVAGTGILKVRESFQEERVKPFELPDKSGTLEVGRVQKKGASMHQTSIWEGQLAPLAQPMRDGEIVVSPIHYVIQHGGLLRTETRSLSTNYFGGLSLTVRRGGSLLLSGTDGSTVIHDLRLEGGQVIANMAKGRMTHLNGIIGGRMRVSEKSMVVASGPVRNRVKEKVTIEAELEGSGALEIDLGSGRELIVRSRDNHEFLGGWYLLSGNLVAKARDALGKGGVTLARESQLKVKFTQHIGILTAHSLGDLSLEKDLHVTEAVINGEELPSGEYTLVDSRGKLVVGP